MALNIVKKMLKKKFFDKCDFSMTGQWIKRNEK